MKGFKLLRILGGGYSGGGINTLNDWVVGNFPPPYLFVCSGRYPSRGIRLDIRREVGPDIQAKAEMLPFRDGIFGTVVCDPPWEPEHAQDIYGTDAVNEKEMLREAARVTRPGGVVVLAGIRMPWLPAEDGLEPIGVHPVIPLYPMRIFALFLWRKRVRLSMFSEAP